MVKTRLRDEGRSAGFARAAPQNTAVGIGMSFDPIDPAATREKLLDRFRTTHFPLCRHHDLSRQHFHPFAGSNGTDLRSKAT
jgi:hypothetical protein